MLVQNISNIKNGSMCVGMYIVDMYLYERIYLNANVHPSSFDHKYVHPFCEKFIVLHLSHFMFFPAAFCLSSWAHTCIHVYAEGYI